MAILWKPQAKKNPASGAVKYYAQATFRQQVGFEGLAAEIEKLTSLTAGDALNMLRTMQYLIVQHLLDNDTVKFDNLGTFMLSLKSTPSDTEAAVTADNIKSLHVRFRPVANVLGNTKATKAIAQSDVEFKKFSDVAADDTTGD